MEPGHARPDTLQAEYRIIVQGHVALHWTQWFGDLAVTRTQDAGGLPVTVLTGPVPDQPALRGILNKLWDLNLTLISVARMTGDES
jgi:hypothetical protein